MTLAALLNISDDGRFCGTPVTPDHYFFLRGGREFHFRTPQRVTLAAVTVDLERFAAYCQRVGELPPPGACVDNGLTLLDYFESAITGGDGNREFFVWAKRAA